MPARKATPKGRQAGTKRPSQSKPRRAKTKAEEPRKRPGTFGIRTAPKGDRFHAPETAVRKHALAMPQATEDFRAIAPKKVAALLARPRAAD